MKKYHFGLNRNVHYYPFCQATLNAGNSLPAIRVVSSDCLMLSQQLTREFDCVPCILNCANQYQVGGDYISGRGQEESLIRRTDLLSSLIQLDGVEKKPGSDTYFYKLQNAFGIYNTVQCSGFGEFACLFSELVTVMKTSVTLNQDKYFPINVLSSAAYNLSDLAYRPSPDWYWVGTIFKILNQLRVAKLHCQRHLILGAFGCGAFENSPEVVAQIYHAVLYEYEFLGCFDQIYFAIDTSYSTQSQSIYEAFMREFSISTPKKLVHDMLLEARAWEMINEFSVTAQMQLHDMLLPFCIQYMSKDQFLYICAHVLMAETECYSAVSSKPAKGYGLFCDLLSSLRGKNCFQDGVDVLLNALTSDTCRSLTKSSGIFKGARPGAIIKLERIINSFFQTQTIAEISNEKNLTVIGR